LIKAALFAAVQAQLLSIAPSGDSQAVRALKVFAFAGLFANLGATSAYVAWGRTMAWVRAIIQLSDNQSPRTRIMQTLSQPKRYLVIYTYAFILELIARGAFLTGSICLLCHIGIHVWVTETPLIAGITMPFFAIGASGLVIISFEYIFRGIHGLFLIDIVRRQ
jgi:hypothetical protein